MKSKSFYALLFLFIPLFSIAQDSDKDIVIGEKAVIHSDLLDEDRTVWIGLPDGYSSENKYPVFYLLDGPGHFQHTTGSAKFLQRNDKAPGLIIVAIDNTDRTRDLTPQAVSTEEPGEKDIPFDYSTGGGADNFLSFIEDELMPYIESNYSTAEYKGLIGHSFGGLFAVHALLNQPDLFDAYISISPSLWFDHQSFLTQAEKVFKDGNTMNSSFYMTMGNEGGAMLGGAMKLAALLEEYADNMNWEFVPMPKETHGSVPHRSTYDGLEFLFSDWAPPMPNSYEEFSEMMASNGAEGIIQKMQNHYSGLTQKYGFTVTEESVVNQLGYILIQEKKFDEALVAMRHNAENFPESANAFDSLGDAYKETGDVENARKSYEQAIVLADKYNHPVGKVSKEKLEGLNSQEN